MEPLKWLSTSHGMPTLIDLHAINTAMMKNFIFSFRFFANRRSASDKRNSKGVTPPPHLNFRSIDACISVYEPCKLVLSFCRLFRDTLNFIEIGIRHV